MRAASPPRHAWDYLIVTAANAPQAAAYEAQIRFRRQAGRLPQVRDVLVVPDMEGRRIGSGASTLHCLATLVNRESEEQGGVRDGADAGTILRRLRILIVHAGGDSRRLPAYSSCGKIFVPLPGEYDSPWVTTLFDRLVATFLDLPPGPPDLGQVVVAAGDALIGFDPAAVDLSIPGLTALGAWTTPEEASRHGVFCAASGRESVRVYLQKPALQEQLATGAVDGSGRSIVDVGVMSLDSPSAAALLQVFCDAASGTLAWKPEMRQNVLAHGLDLYREVCCAMGSEATLEHYLRTARAAGSTWQEPVLAGLFPALRAVPLNLQVLDPCTFLHFGSTRQLISSGLALVAGDSGAPPASTALMITTEVQPGVPVTASASWVEACRVRAPLRLRGSNVLAGVDVSEPLDLPAEACLDVSKGRNRRGEPVWFVRCHGVNDTFKHAVGAGASFCGMPLDQWLRAIGVPDSEIWEDAVPQRGRTLWNARNFPAENERGGYRRWLWMFDAARATPEQIRAFRSADRYSSAEIALLVNQEAFYADRQAIHTLKHAVRTIP